MHIYFFFLFVPSLRYKCKRPDFTPIFIDSVDSLNSPVYFVPPCRCFTGLCQVVINDVHYVLNSPRSFFNYNFVIPESILIIFGKRVIGEVSIMTVSK